MDQQNLRIVILVISAAVQASAAIISFRLISITGRRTAWLSISAALALMAVRRVIPLYYLLSGVKSIAPDPIERINRSRNILDDAYRYITDRSDLL